MIIILEGCNGVGKSTYAQALEASGYTTLRPFRPHPGFHFTGSTRLERELRDLGVAVNTHVDDLYVADILGRLGNQPAERRPWRPDLNVVLDRSMPSAIAYSGVHPDDWWKNAPKLMNLWHSSLESCQVVYAWLRAPWRLCDERTKGRDFGRWTQVDMHSRFSVLFSMVRFPKLELDTSTMTIADGIQQIIDKAE